MLMLGGCQRKQYGENKLKVVFYIFIMEFVMSEKAFYDR
jgi:hypothetical protein